ncbi:hypothetical protein CW744_03800 [Staphylococcus xylosus]|uniref:hypothetical protein n=1 Tax=Staphylococcus xylosus TaxID=1288 RepID=UPI000C3408DB|nr:hypothetical protein [Staphylococcus xylosus]PKI05364.1 hypothetical protein CW744_03800 [Staphylococcus xylosus]
MKKLLFLLVASFLILSACGNEENSEDKKETKSSDKESKKKDNTNDKSDKKKSDDKEKVVTQDETTKQPVQSQEQVNTQEQQSVQSQEQAPVAEEQTPEQQEPIDKEQWARENIAGGTDAHAAEEMDAYYQQERAKEQAEKDAQFEKEEKLHDEYNSLTEEMYGEDSDLSDEEMQKLEEKQDAILDQVEPIN